MFSVLVVVKVQEKFIENVLQVSKIEFSELLHALQKGEIHVVIRLTD